MYKLETDIAWVNVCFSCSLLTLGIAVSGGVRLHFDSSHGAEQAQCELPFASVRPALFEAVSQVASPAAALQDMLAASSVKYRLRPLRKRHRLRALFTIWRRLRRWHLCGRLTCGLFWGSFPKYAGGFVGCNLMPLRRWLPMPRSTRNSTNQQPQ